MLSYDFLNCFVQSDSVPCVQAFKAEYAVVHFCLFLWIFVYVQNLSRVNKNDGNPVEKLSCTVRQVLITYYRLRYVTGIGEIDKRQ